MLLILNGDLSTVKESQGADPAVRAVPAKRSASASDDTYGGSCLAASYSVAVA